MKFTTALNLDILKRIGKTENFEVAANDPKYKSVDGMIYSKDRKTLIRIPLGRKKVVIPESCTTVTAGSYGYAIGDDIYGVESTMSEIVFSKTVTKIISDGTSVDLGHYECKDIKITLNMDYLDNESIQQLWASNVCWEKSLKNELMRKGLAKLNEENERMLMLSDGYLCGYLTEDENDINKIEKHETINGLVVPDNVKTIGQRLYDHGIQCGYIGKWHLDGSDYFGNGRCPEGWDPEYWYDMKTYLNELTDEEKVKSRNPKECYKDDFSEEFTYAHRCSNRAIKYLEKHQNNDFFLSVSYDEPHGPSLCPKPYNHMYDGFKFDSCPNFQDDLSKKTIYAKTLVW